MEPEEVYEIITDTVRHMVAEAAVDIDDEWQLLQILGVEQ